MLVGSVRILVVFTQNSFAPARMLVHYVNCVFMLLRKGLTIYSDFTHAVI